MTSKTNTNPGLEIDPVEGQFVGRHPKSMSLEEWQELGQEPKSAAKAIRAYCLDCSGGQPSEVRRCVRMRCPLAPFRMGSSPFHGKATQAEKSAVDEGIFEAA